MTIQEETRIRTVAVVEWANDEYIATYGDFEGHGDTTQAALDQLVIGMQYYEET
jgi:hypothetical protein